MNKDRRVIESNKSQEKKKVQKVSEPKKNLQKMKASTSAPFRSNYQTRSRAKQEESSSESESDWDSDWKEFLRTYVPPRESSPSSSFDSNQLDSELAISEVESK
jgi:hypothetical protein